MSFKIIFLFLISEGICVPYILIDEQAILVRNDTEGYIEEIKVHACLFDTSTKIE